MADLDSLDTLVDDRLLQQDFSRQRVYLGSGGDDFARFLLNIGVDFSKKTMSYFSIVPPIRFLCDMPRDVSSLKDFTPAGTSVYEGKSVPAFGDDIVDGLSLHRRLIDRGYVVCGAFQQMDERLINPSLTLAEWAFDIAASLYDRVVVIPGDLAFSGEKYKPKGWSQILYAVPSAKLIERESEKRSFLCYQMFMVNKDGFENLVPV